jgi:hypothetical protein
MKAKLHVERIQKRKARRPRSGAPDGNRSTAPPTLLCAPRGDQSLELKNVHWNLSVASDAESGEHSRRVHYGNRLRFTSRGYKSLKDKDRVNRP